jgi:transposase
VRGHRTRKQGNRTSKEVNKLYEPDILENGDTLNQLLARSRYLLNKSETNWTPKQVYRAEILFRLYPKLEETYKLCKELSLIFTSSNGRMIAFKKLAL